MTGDEVASFAEEPPVSRLAAIDRGGTPRPVTILNGSARTLTDPNDVRYVGFRVVRRMMDLDDDAGRLDAGGAPTGVASRHHRQLT